MPVPSRVSDDKRVHVIDCGKFVRLLIGKAKVDLFPDEVKILTEFFIDWEEAQTDDRKVKEARILASFKKELEDEVPR